MCLHALMLIVKRTTLIIARFQHCRNRQVIFTVVLGTDDKYFVTIIICSNQHAISVSPRHEGSEAESRRVSDLHSAFLDLWPEMPTVTSFIATDPTPLNIFRRTSHNR